MFKRLIVICVILLSLVACSSNVQIDFEVEMNSTPLALSVPEPAPTSKIEATTNYNLKSPWDTRLFKSDAALLSGQCPDPKGLPTQIPDRLENGENDETAWATLTNIDDILLLSDLAVSKGSQAAATCVLDHLNYWAENDAFIVDKECRIDGAHWEHGYDRSNFTNGVLAIPFLQIRNAPILDKAKKTNVLSWFEKLYLCNRTRAEGMLLDAQENGLGPHNQLYPALLAVATTSLVLDKTDGFNWSIEKYKQSIGTIAEDGTALNEVANKMEWTLHYHTVIENFCVHLSLLGHLNGFTGLFEEPSFLRLTQLVLDSYDDPTYIEELTGYEQTQNPLTTPWNLSWVEHLKRFNTDPRLSQLATKFKWQMNHTHTGGHPEYWWVEYWE